MLRIESLLSASRKASLPATLTIMILGAGVLTLLTLVAVDRFTSHCFTVLAEVVRYIAQVYTADGLALKLPVLCLSIDTLIKLVQQWR